MSSRKAPPAPLVQEEDFEMYDDDDSQDGWVTEDEGHPSESDSDDAPPHLDSDGDELEVSELLILESAMVHGSVGEAARASEDQTHPVDEFEDDGSEYRPSPSPTPTPSETYMDADVDDAAIREEVRTETGGLCDTEATTTGAVEHADAGVAPDHAPSLPVPKRRGIRRPFPPCRFCTKRRINCSRPTDGSACAACRRSKTRCSLCDSRRGRRPKSGNRNASEPFASKARQALPEQVACDVEKQLKQLLDRARASVDKMERVAEAVEANLDQMRTIGRQVNAFASSRQFKRVMASLERTLMNT